MKKKQIEAIPFMEQVELPEEHTYLAAVSTKKLDVKTLLVDIYERTGPICRIALTKSDYATYMVKDEKWSSTTIKAAYGVIWDTRHNSYDVTRKTSISGDDLAKIKDFTKNSQDWVTNIQYFQQDIKEDKESDREENWKKKHAQRMKETPPHSVGFIAWAKAMIPENYLYYLRKGNYAYITCSHCGQREKYYTGNVTTFEQQFIKRIEIPRAGEKAKCLKCGALASYKCEGRIKNNHIEKIKLYDVQKFQETGVCISLVEVEKIYRLGYEEEYKVRDEAKLWYKSGRKTPEAAYNHGSWERDRWDKNREEWSSKIVLGDYMAYLGNNQLKDTCLQYSGYEAYRKDIIGYMNTYLKNPEIEMLAKLKFTHIVEEMIRGTARIDVKGKKLADKLMIWPERVEMLQKKRGQANYWRLYKIEKRNGYHFQEELCQILLKHSYYKMDEIEEIIKYITPVKCVNYLNKVGWSQMDTYKDYLAMREEQGYDMTDSIILFPKNLGEEHDRLVLEKNKEDRERRKAEKNKTYKEIEQMYPKLAKIYGFEDETFVIRPTANAGELIDESTLLHHCVGTSDNYMKGHQEKRAYILFLRKKETPDTPYCTIEMTPEGIIRQWQQKYDKKPDREVIEPWLQQYTKQLKEKLCS